MTPGEILAALTQQQALGLTAWAEARGDWRQGGSSIEERLAVMLVCRNRLKRHVRFGAAAPDYRLICLARLQFSCWNHSTTDTNHLELMAMADAEVHGAAVPALVEETLWLAGGIIQGTVVDFTKGADHYYAPKAMKPAGSAPKWAKRNGVIMSPLCIVGDQHFYAIQ